jgi:hypothetical protein
VRVYEPREDEEPAVYELGVPVVEFDGDEPWHVDVSQKVPLTMDRTNVKPAFLQQVRVEVLNRMHDQLDKEQAASKWARAATGDDRVSPEAVQTVKTKRFGEKAVIADKSDPEGTKIAMSRGYTVIHGGSLSKDEWSQYKKHEVVKPAGKVTPSPKAYSNSPDADPANFLPKTEWTREMKFCARHVEDLAEVLLDVPLTVRFNTNSNNFGAAWCESLRGTELHFSLKQLGRRFFADAATNRHSQIRLHDLMLHEFGHHYSSDHFSHKFLDAVTRLGARLTELALRESKRFKLLKVD